MTRLAIAFLLSARLASASPAEPTAGAFPTERGVRAQAASSVEDICKNAKDECENARALLEVYRSLLTEAAGCGTDNGGADNVARIARAVWDADERESRLPRFPGRTGRPLLSLSALISVRLADAAVRLGKPNAAGAPRWNPDIEAPKVVESACLISPAVCGELRAMLSENEQLYPLALDCAARACPFEAADSLVVRSDRQLSRYLTASIPAAAKTLPVFSLLSRTRDTAVKGLSGTLERTMRDLNARTGELAARVDRAQAPGGAGADISALPGDGATLQETYRQALFGADRLAHVLGYEKSSTQREKVNVATARISGLRARALALMAARGFKDARAQDLGVAATGASTTAKARPPLSPATAPTLLDRRAVPIPADAAVPAPPILSGDPKWLTLIENARSDDPILRADALRRLHQTKTVGNPGLYAAHAYTQENPSGCAVATQVQVLKAHGLLPPGDPVLQERELIAEGTRRGLFDDGTPAEYSADLLAAHGMLVRRQLKASWFNFEKAVKTGHALQVGVDARFIWDRTDPNKLPHSILVTGAEVSKSSGELLGVYINDTGRRPPGAGRFIPREMFRKAWSGDMAEIQ